MRFSVHKGRAVPPYLNKFQEHFHWISPPFQQANYIFQVFPRLFNKWPTFINFLFWYYLLSLTSELFGNLQRSRLISHKGNGMFSGSIVHTKGPWWWWKHFVERIYAFLKIEENPLSQKSRDGNPSTRSTRQIEASK